MRRVAVDVRAEQQVVAHGRAGEDAPSFGDVRDPARTIRYAGTRVMSSPSKRIVPLFARTKPLIARSSEVLPAPFAPISATIVPGLGAQRDACSARIPS
jgi:hypothetical protein